MEDREVSVRTVCSVTLWVIGMALVVLDALTEGISSGQIGLATIGGAMVLTLRGYFCTFYARQRDMFEAGRDYERSVDYDDRVRSIR